MGRLFVKRVKVGIGNVSGDVVIPMVPSIFVVGMLAAKIVGQSSVFLDEGDTISLAIKMGSLPKSV